jgi:TnpA family transposase
LPIGQLATSGTPRDSLHMIDVVYSQDGGQRPDVIVSDAAAYSDLVFGLVHVLDMDTARPWLICPITRAGD